LPVVSTPIGDIAAMLCDGEAGLLVAPGDPSAIAGAVARLLEESDLATRIAGRAREELKRYTWSRIREQWTAIYAEVLTPTADRRGDRSPAQSFPSHV
jgi:glycosyltransferase involved in cell wall biosynthesis